MSSPIYVIGHRHPDADAICSAIAYAAFKQATGCPEAVAARCGNSNARIDAILQRFNQPLPLFLGDVTPRVRDIMTRHPFGVGPTSTCAEALELIDRHDVRVLPVVRSDGTVEGTISIFQLGEYFLPKPREPRLMRHVHSTLADIVRSLHATVHHLVEPDRTEDLYVRVGAMDIRSFGKFANEEPTLASQSIIVVGDRWDIQQKSIQAGVRLLVITGGLPVEDDILTLARERGVSVIGSAYDSGTTSWIIRSATRVDRLVQRKFPTYGPEEKLAAVRRKVSGSFSPAYLVLDEDGRLLGLFTNGDLLKAVATRLILVDHNELSQAVTGADQVTVLEIIDHHRLGNPPTQQPILFLNDPVGSTCTIVAEQFRRLGLPVAADLAGILMGGIIADTLHLQSPTSTPRDAEILAWLSEGAGVTSTDLATLIFSSGSVILSQKPEAVIRGDLKIYEEGGVRYAVSQVEELGFGNFHHQAEPLLAALEQVRAADNLFFASLLVTDINTQNSLLAVAGDPDLIAQITYPVVEKGRVYDLPGVVSRKKQLIPYFHSLLRGLGLPV